MRQNYVLFIFIILILFGISIPSSSKGKGSKGMVPYEEGKIVSIVGTITNIETIFNPVTKEDGLHIELATSLNKYTVHVCPQWYADNQKLQFSKGELLTIKGSEFIKDNKPNIYAANIIRRFSSLSKKDQIKVASEVMMDNNPTEIAEKYNISVDEVAIIKDRVEKYLEIALFPEPLVLRDLNTGDGLWRERHTEQRNKIKEQKYKKMKKNR